MNPVLQFDPKKHQYSVSGRVLPSVTQILKAAGLIDYSMIPQDVLRAAAWRGTAVHQALQFMDDGELDESSVPPELAGYIEAARRFYAESGFEVAHNEFRDYHRTYLYAGTMDRTGTFPDGSLAIVDWKTGLVMPGHGLQLVAYANLLSRPRAYRRIALKLNDDGTYRVHEYPPQNFERDWAVFLSGLACFNWALQYATGKAA